MSRPLLAIAMGDPSGVGPEVALKALADPEVQAEARGILIGPARVALALRDHLRLPLGLSLVGPHLEELPEEPGWAPLLSVSDEPVEHFPTGQVSAESGHAAAAAVETAARLALEGRVDGIVTAPVHPEALRAAGYAYPDTTALLEALSGAESRTALLGHRLRVTLVTEHCALREAVERIAWDRVATAIRTAEEAARLLGIAHPRIAVAGLNPHAGAGGLFGREELEQIAPAVAEARLAGLDVAGPFPPDAVFHRAALGEFDIVVAMTHDHGRIPMAMLGPEQAASASLGLPFVRTAPLHGPAYELAGRGIAPEGSMAEAIRLAARLQRARKGSASPS